MIDIGRSILAVAFDLHLIHNALRFHIPYSNGTVVFIDVRNCPVINIHEAIFAVSMMIISGPRRLLAIRFRNIMCRILFPFCSRNCLS